VARREDPTSVAAACGRSPIKPTGQAYTSNGLQPFVTPRALETGEIEAVVEQFGAAAWRARESNFDGVEIHAANGYLIDQFLRDGTNRRKDKYGGTLANRIRFLLEVSEAVVGVWGRGRVGVRLSPTNPFNDMCDSNPVRTFTTAAQELNGLGLAYLHVVEPSSGSSSHGQLAPRTLPSIRAVFGGPIVVNGGYTATAAETTLLRGEADLASFGTLFLANPDLVHRFRIGAMLNDPDESTFYGGDARGYTDYPPHHQADGSAAA
jgi:N-ethylmaleimide reductase